MAIFFYLPQTMSNIIRRAWYYVFGDPNMNATQLKAMVERKMASVGESVMEAVGANDLTGGHVEILDDVISSS